MMTSHSLLLLLAGCLLACGESAVNDANLATGGGGGSSAESSGGSATGGAAPSGGSDAGSENLAGVGGDTPSGPPKDDRPPRPEWDPPLPTGESGWEESDEPLCEPHQGTTRAFSVWADERGVAAFFSTECNPLAGQVECVDAEGSSLQFNDGTGWRWLYSGGSMAPNLSGLPGGPLVLTGHLQGQAGIFFLDDGEAELSYPLDDPGQARVFGVNPKLAYAIAGGDVLEYRAGEWTTLGTLPTRPMALWADDQVLAVVGLDQTFWIRSSGSGELQPAEGALAGDYTAVWGFAADDIWAGNDAGQLVHYDGADWTIVPTGSRDRTGSGITGLWGDAGVLYFTTFTEFGRANADGVQLIYQRDPNAAPNEPYFSPQALWGRSATEVFVSISDERFEDYRCGSAFITWFDGEVFHQF